MKGNDLSNQPQPRDLLVFEGLFGLIPDEKVARQERKFRAKEKWDEAVACYAINELLARKVIDLQWRFNIRIDLLTYHGRPFGRALEERMENEGMPFGKIMAEEPNILARSLALRPDIRSVYDPFPDHQFLYGGKGRIISPEDAPYLLGAM